MGSRAVLRITIALCLCLAGAFVSGVLLGQHYGEAWAVSAARSACGDSQTSGCEEVARSSWSSFGGKPLAAYGMAFYLSLFILLLEALIAPPELRNWLGGLGAALLALGLLLDLLLLGVQAFSIHAYCTLCIFTYLLSAVAFLTLFPARRSLSRAAAAIRPEGRLALVGWIAVSLTIAVSVLELNAILEARAANRQATLLGTPPPSANFQQSAPSASIEPSPIPAAPETADRTVLPKPQPPTASKATPNSKDAEYWEKQAKALQLTLDDPAKVEAYWTEKSLREYETSAAKSIDLAGLPSAGPTTAPVTVVEYSDFLCAYCRNLASALSKFVPQSGGRVIIYFKNFPLDQNCNDRLVGSTHPGACNLAMGGICAFRQNKFEAYHDRVFSTELQNPQLADVVRLAGEAGLDAAAMQSCMDDPKTRAVLAAQVAEGNRLGVHSTPTVYLNGKKLPRLNDFITIVDKEARKKGFKPMSQ